MMQEPTGSILAAPGKWPVCSNSSSSQPSFVATPWAMWTLSKCRWGRGGGTWAQTCWWSHSKYFLHCWSMIVSGYRFCIKKSQILGESEDTVNTNFIDPSESVVSSALKAAKWQITCCAKNFHYCSFASIFWHSFIGNGFHELWIAEFYIVEHWGTAICKRKVVIFRVVTQTTYTVLGNKNWFFIHHLMQHILML